MVFGITTNFTSQFQDTFEAFENNEEDENIVNNDELIESEYINNQEENEKENNNMEYLDETNDNVIEEINENDDMDNGQENNENNDMDNGQENNENDDMEIEEIISEENFDDIEEEEEGFTNLFKGSNHSDYKNMKNLLKSILAGLIFFILCNKKIITLSKSYFKGFDTNLIHALIFFVIIYITNITF